MATPTPHRATLQPLLDELQEQIRAYEQSRRIMLPPSERARRIRERRDWIAAITALLDLHDTVREALCSDATF